MLSQKFSRDKRLVTAADYRRVFSKPQKSADTYFTVLARPGRFGNDVSRLGLAIAKKQLRKATERNRIKRLARETFRRRNASMNAIDFVVLVRATARQASNRVLFESLNRHFQRLTEICNRR